MKNTWRFGEAEFDYVREVLDSGFGSSTSGSMNNRFESAFAEKVGAKYAITFNSGTSTLHAALDAVGVGYGDEVITPPLTVISNLDVILAQNAVPVFADIDPETFNMDPEEMAAKITPKTKAIMPVHLTGRICDMDPIVAIAEKHGLKIIEDAAQSMGSEYKGRKSGTFGDVGCFSCHPLKNMNACGDGGLITTNDSDIRDRAIRLRNHGMIDRNTALEFGFVSRMDNLQAAILRLRLRHLPDVVARRRRNVEQYRAEIDTDHVYIPPCLDHEFNTFVLFVAQLDRRDELQAYLAERGISTGIHYPVPIHLQPAARYLGHKAGDYPEVERQADRIISLPHNQNLSESQVSYVCEQINRFYMTG